MGDKINGADHSEEKDNLFRVYTLLTEGCWNFFSDGSEGGEKK